jgi:hypothetical protein
MKEDQDMSKDFVSLPQMAAIWYNNITGERYTVIGEDIEVPVSLHPEAWIQTTGWFVPVETHDAGKVVNDE